MAEILVARGHAFSLETVEELSTAEYMRRFDALFASGARFEILPTTAAERLKWGEEIDAEARKRAFFEHDRLVEAYRTRKNVVATPDGTIVRELKGVPPQPGEVVRLGDREFVTDIEGRLVLVRDRSI